MMMTMVGGDGEGSDDDDDDRGKQVALAYICYGRS